MRVSYINDYLKPFKYDMDAIHRSSTKAYLLYLKLNSKLMQQNQPFIAATYAIDLYWHAHMMHPAAYMKDFWRINGTSA